MMGFISNQIWVTDPDPSLVSWCAKTLTVDNPDYEKKVRMGFWVGSTPEKLHLYSVEHGTLVLPYGLMGQLQQRGVALSNAFAISMVAEYGGEGVPLYDYQRKAVDAMIRAGYGILQSPAGSGKTQMGIALMKALRRRTLWLTHTKDLLKQSMERAARYINPAMIGTITEGKVNIGEGVTFATVQTMCKLDLQRYRDTWDVIITDECHHVAGSPTRVTQFQKVLNNLSARHKFGLSATVHRADGLVIATHAILGPTQYVVDDAEVAGKIMPVKVRALHTGMSTPEEALNPDGTVQYARLINALADNDARNDFILDELDWERDHSCLILSERVHHLENLMNTLPARLKDKAVLITGKTPAAQREEALEQMRSGEKKYLFATYQLAKEGLDIPRLDRLFLATPQKDYAVVVQSVGRVARTFPGKDTPIVFDFVDENIRFCARAFKERCRHYRKCGATME